ncbi:MAG TPA: right-handed parallel beta-helix repeat-containing protein [Tahibacter sp.]|uniref:right-handed parallel beta-helix repeat-containing protein n=1 Tax=Tahibacter sp. TaxID=2056211 RepID=UPI002C568F5A|nr:right-handed parallel beta-helix repeat-containing protein [Tahibacter sp.]HSX61220.1 right-handed parallel beta-helix repeat-containing protein [Tahibacter sp.]
MSCARPLGFGLLFGVAAAPAFAQTSVTLGAIEGYGNLETAGAVATIAGDTNRNANVALQWRRSGEPTFRAAQDLLRVDATHFAGSLFGLAPGTNYELRLTVSDPDGVGGTASATAAFATRADTLVEPTLRTVYVAATGGNDGNDGLSPGQAVASVQRGANIAQAGDVVSIAPGIYREQVSLPRSGTAAQPIVFRGQPGAVLDGAERIAAGSSWEASQGLFRRADASPSWQVLADAKRLFRYDSIAELQALAAGAPGGYCYSGGFLYLKLADGSSPAAHAIDVARRESGFVADGRSHLRIEGMEIRHYGSTEYGKGIYLRQSNDVIVRANRIHDIGSAGIWVKGGARHRIEDNELYDTSIPDWPWDQTKGSSAENNGVAFTDDIGRGHVVRRNRFEGWFNGIGPCGSSAPAGAVTTEVDVYRNRFRRHNDDALEPEGYCANVRLFENTIRDSHMAFAVAPAAPGPTWIVRNVAYDIGNTRTSQVDDYVSSLLKINSGYPEAVGPVLLLHNTVQTTAPETDAVYLLTPGNSTFIRSRNNIYAATRTVLTKVNAVALDWNHDLLHTTSTTRFAHWMGTNYATLAAFSAATNQEIDGIAAAPSLVAPAAGDFRLRSDSAARDRGAVLPGINDGYVGTGPDLGAFEFDPERIFADGFSWPTGAPPLP